MIELDERTLEKWYRWDATYWGISTQLQQVIDELRATRRERDEAIALANHYCEQSTKGAERIAELEQQLVEVNTALAKQQDATEVLEQQLADIIIAKKMMTHSLEEKLWQSQRDQRIEKLENIIRELKGTRTEDQWDVAVSIAEAALAKEPTK